MSATGRFAARRPNTSGGSPSCVVSSGSFAMRRRYVVRARGARVPAVSVRADTAAAIVIGDEILSGKFAEENAAYLIRELRSLGVALRRVVYIPDVIDDIADTVAECARRFDHVFTSGGVGPTHDDLTMEGVARAFG